MCLLKGRNDSPDDNPIYSFLITGPEATLGRQRSSETSVTPSLNASRRRLHSSPGAELCPRNSLHVLENPEHLDERKQ